METISVLNIFVDTDIVFKMFYDVSIMLYRVIYFAFALFGSIMSFIRLSDDISVLGKVGAEEIFFSGMFMGFGFAAISVLFHSNVFPISTFFVAIGADCYFLFGDSRIIDILKKDYL